MAWRGAGAVGWMGARGGTRLNPATNGVGGNVGEGHAKEAVATTKRAERESGATRREKVGAAAQT